MPYQRICSRLKFMSIATMWLVFAVPAHAMSVTPLTVDMTTARGASQISVTNDGAKSLPVEIVVSRLELDEKGEMTTTPAPDDFIIFPPQAIVKPGSSQAFRIQWAGDPQLNTSQNYIFSVNQVPVKMPAGQSGVQVVFNFAAVVNIAASNGSAEINLIQAGVGKDAKGKLHPEITVKNPGNSYAKLTDATIKLSGGSWSETLAPDKLRQIVGIGLVQPGKTRKFVLPVDVPDGVKQITANIDYKPAK